MLNHSVGSFLYRTNCGDDRIDAPCTAWLLKGPGGPILVDTGPGPRARAPQHYRPNNPDDLLPLELARHGVDPLAVQTIIVTHLYNDHASGARLFPNATFHVQLQELQLSGQCRSSARFTRSTNAASSHARACPLRALSN